MLVESGVGDDGDLWRLGRAFARVGARRTHSVTTPVGAPLAAGVCTQKEPLARARFAGCEQGRIVAGEQSGGVLGDSGHGVLNDLGHGVLGAAGEPRRRVEAQQQRPRGAGQRAVEGIDSRRGGDIPGDVRGEGVAQILSQAHESALAMLLQPSLGRHEVMSQEPGRRGLRCRQLIVDFTADEAVGTVDEREGGVLLGARDERG